MHKLISNFFNFLRSLIKFIKILLVLLIVLLILYWIQDLTQKTWPWFSPLTPYFKEVLELGKKVSSESIMLFAAVFEFKYLVIMSCIILTYIITHIAYLLTDYIEDFYNSGRLIYKKFEENSLNTKLAIEQTYEQKKIKLYQIYIQTFIKQNIAHREFNINLEEQNKILIKHLLEKTGVCPNKYQEGFLFQFSSFNKIDDVLEVFLNVKNSQAPLDFLICLQILETNNNIGNEDLNTLIGLKILNKITTLANTAYRYRYNENQRYKTIQIGLYQKDKKTFEVHEFTSII